MRGLNILVIDDEPAMVDMVRKILEKDGHKVITAENGLEGLRIFEKALKEQKPFDLVITDLGMPQIGGEEVVTVVKALSPSTSVILLSGWDSQAPLGRKVLAFADLILHKPVTGKELRNTVKRIVEAKPNFEKRSAL